MATMIVKHRVANFDSWKAVFDSLEHVRREHGWVSTRVLRDAADPNIVCIVNRAKSLDGIKRYGASDALKQGMANGGVQGAPEVQFFDDAAETAY